MAQCSGAIKSETQELPSPREVELGAWELFHAH